MVPYNSKTQISSQQCKIRNKKKNLLFKNTLIVFLRFITYELIYAYLSRIQKLQTKLNFLFEDYIFFFFFKMPVVWKKRNNFPFLNESQIVFTLPQISREVQISDFIADMVIRYQQWKIHNETYNSQS